jgi:hypothetical protein
MYSNINYAENVVYKVNTIVNFGKIFQLVDQLVERIERYV